jgi:hypothetical protein
MKRLSLVSIAAQTPATDHQIIPGLRRQIDWLKRYVSDT